MKIIGNWAAHDSACAVVRALWYRWLPRVFLIEVFAGRIVVGFANERVSILAVESLRTFLADIAPVSDLGLLAEAHLPLTSAIHMR